MVHEALDCDHLRTDLAWAVVQHGVLRDEAIIEGDL